MLFMFCFLRISLSMAEGFISDVWFLFLGTSLEVFVLAFIIISLTVFIFTLMSLCESLDRFSATFKRVRRADPSWWQCTILTSNSLLGN